MIDRNGVGHITQRQELVKVTNAQSSASMKSSRRKDKRWLGEIILAAFGIIISLIGLLRYQGYLFSTVITLAGVSIVTFAIMFHFFSEPRSLRSEVYYAMVIPGMIMADRVLSVLVNNQNPVYLPHSQTTPAKIFLAIPKSLKQDGTLTAIGSITEIFNPHGEMTRGVLITPPGYYLFQYAQSLGAVFTPERLEAGIKDVMENGMELASSVSVQRNGTHVQVILRDLTCAGMCQPITKADPGFCQRIGCPVRSLVSCMVAECTGMEALERDINVSKNDMGIIYDLY